MQALFIDRKEQIKGIQWCTIWVVKCNFHEKKESYSLR